MISAVVLHYTLDSLQDDVLYQCNNCSVIQRNRKIWVVSDGNVWGGRGRKKSTTIKHKGITVMMKPNVVYEEYVKLYSDKITMKISIDDILKLFDDFVNKIYSSRFTKEKYSTEIQRILVFGTEITGCVKMDGS